MSSLGTLSFVLEVSRMRKIEQRIPYFSWGVPKVRSLRAGNRQFLVSGVADEEGLEVSSLQRGLVQQNLSPIAEKREAVSSIKLETANTEQALSEINSSSNLCIDLTEKYATSVAPSLDSQLQESEKYETKDIKLEDLNANSLNIGKDVAPEGDIMPSLPLAGVNVMNVLFVAAECGPWSKTGGLGDVCGALPKALARRGHRVMVVVPKYGDYPEPKYTGVYKRYKVDGQDMDVNYYHAYIDGVDYVFLEHSIFKHCQHNIYGGDRLEILKRMALFCRAAVEVPWHVPCGGVCYGDGNLVFIANDWHTALLPVYLKAYYRDHGVMKYARSVLVIHNIYHQVKVDKASGANPDA